jgi:hypothetical protein
MGLTQRTAGGGDVRRYPRKWQNSFGDSGNELCFNYILLTITFSSGFEDAVIL